MTAGEFDIDGFCALIREALAAARHGTEDCRAGRFISAPAMTSVSSVDGQGPPRRQDLVLPGCLYGSYNGQLCDHVTYPVSI